MRGYRFLKDSNDLSRIADVKRTLTTQKLEIEDRQFSKYIFGAGIGQAEIVCRQYLLARVAGLKLNRALLHGMGRPGSSVIFYLPAEWRKALHKKGFKIARLRTALMWNVFVGMMLAYGVLRIVRIIVDGIKTSLKNAQWQLGSYAYFDDLFLRHLPQACKDGRSHDIITWYMQQWADKEHRVDTLCHGVLGSGQRAVNGTPVVPVPGPVPPLSHISSLSRFAEWAIVATMIAGWGFVRGRWWHALLLNEGALAAQARFQEPERLAIEYLFRNSGWIYRPLWTYEAERRGARITFYFYSTNCEGFKRPEGYPAPIYGYQAMNWPYYLVWDDYQRDFVGRCVGDTVKASVVGQIWLQNSSEEMPAIEGEAIAVFDITPHRSSSYQTLAVDPEFYVPDVCLPFLRDIEECTRDAGYVMLWKCKRKSASNAHPQYRRFAEKLSVRENVIIVDPEISANRVIERSTAVISMPFTSTALIAQEIGKPSCYYDPSGMVQKDDRAAHGIEIVSGPQELSLWLRKISDGLYSKAAAG